MSRARVAQSSFVAGEFSPLIEARSDLALYRNGAALLRNRRPRSTGGNDTRPGLRYVATIPYDPARIEPFVFSEDQRYVLVFSNGRLDAFVSDGTPCTPITGAPWTSAMLARLVVITYADSAFVFHPDLAPQRITRTGATTFSLAAFAFESTGANVLRIPFDRYAAPAVTLAASATTGTITLTASAALFEAGHVGVRFRLGKKQVEITVVTNATTATATVIETLTGTAATTDWDEAAFSPARGWPGTATFIDNRLVLAGAKGKPTGIWLSRVGAFFNFDLGTATDSDAIAESIAGGQITQIRHVVGADRLLVLGDSGVWFVPSSASAPLTPNNISFRQVSTIGAAPAEPIRLDEGVLYLDRTGRVVREAVWNETVDSYQVDAVSLAAEHLIASPTEAAAYDGSGTVPERLGFYRTEAGKLALFHSVRAEKIAAWYGWDTAGDIRSIATLRADVFALVRRTIATVPTTFLERFDEAAEALDASAAATSVSATRTFSGFSHLANQTVQVVSRGHALGPVTVSAGGNVTLPDTAPAVTAIEAGLAFEQRIRPMPIDFDMQDGAARGLRKRLIRAIVHVSRAGAFSVAGTDVLLDFAGDNFADPAPTASGLLDIRLRGISREATFDLVVQQPVKVSMLGLTREVQVNG